MDTTEDSYIFSIVWECRVVVCPVASLGSVDALWNSAVDDRGNKMGGVWAVED